MEVQIAVAKVKKYATSESGDTVEIIERPGGGVSVVLADGQSSGRGAKRISNKVARKVIALLAEGVRDGAAARAASDYLLAEKAGRVSATLNILSVDLESGTLVVTRNNSAPALIFQDDQLLIHDEPSQPIGLYRNTRPQILQIPLRENTSACIYTDGLVHAGKRAGSPINTPELFSELVADSFTSAERIADQLLNTAYELDQSRPADDMSVVVLRVTSLTDDQGKRRMSVTLPLI
jgi:serine phosphatase RsbU (regulator of sigma subunit)